uniref:Multidrug resistance protein ABC superfamily n=1 Tax=Phytophthora ramorum TaxID=164328 RepID=H3G523_PHYRM
MYRFATAFDKVLLTVGIITTGANGALFPLMAIVFGNALTGFASTPVDRDSVNSASLDYLYIAIFMFFTDYVSYVAFYYSAERQMKALRGEALKHMLYMDISWYDKHDALQLSSRLTGDTVRIKDGMGHKLGYAIRYMIQFIVGFIIGFARGWDITLVMACVMPIMAISLSWLIKTMTIMAEFAQKVYAEAGSVAEETLGSMRTVASLNSEHKAIQKFEKKVFEAEKENIALHKMSAVVFSLFIASIYVMYSAGLWYGGWKASNGNTTPGDVFAAFFGVMMGSTSLGQISPNITAVSKAAGAAEELFAILDTASVIDAEKEGEGVIPDSCKGKIEAVNVNFTYPSRPEAQILRDYNVTIEPGQTVAFAGASGGGKSTLIALIERFYDPTSGTIYLDGRDVKTLNVKWLRSQIGMVSQEPVLFATTIFENIAMGGDNVTRDEAIAACKLSNAHNFIMSLPESYDTLVGEKGVSLSGGQKQRVAIARAIVRKPNILVLDEATSALDNESEKIVQAALNDLMATTNMTTLVIAHRLSTIRHADKIVVLNEGHIVESGTHDELLQIEHGIYQNMYRIQELRSHEEQQEAEKREAENDLSGTKLSRSVMDDNTITFTEMMRTMMAIMMSIQIVSSGSNFLRDAPKAFKAGSTIFAIRDRIAPIDSFSTDGLRLAKIEGRLEFKDISFRYPTRPEMNVLKNYNLTVEAGQTVAFCGPSGGGKSTIISLIERFYDPVVGEVLLDGHNIKDLNLNWLRSQIGLVGQEPTLFIGTIADNISYGLAEQPSQQEIEEAAKMANAHDFITQFPDGYATQVGMKGEQLSGGQKQRIAIARAILKNPNILLLDEATSALDSESEKMVQEALDKVVALKRRTTIVIAHRLSTIRHADKICVVSGGKIAEQGTHQELIQLNGIYAGLI